MTTAAELRERRKMKILMGSEERMKKLMGLSSNDHKEPVIAGHPLPAGTSHYAGSGTADDNINGSPEETTQPSHKTNARHTRDIDKHTDNSTNGARDGFANELIYNDPLIEDDDLPSPNLDHCVPDLITGRRTIHPTDSRRSSTETASDQLFTDQQSADQDEVGVEEPKVSHRTASYYRWRTVLMLVAGVVVRLAFLFSVGPKFVESLFNPFVATEIALYGYQRATGLVLDDSSAAGGGVWLMALRLSGIEPSIIRSYTSVLGTVTLIFNDFAVYFFAFVLAHIIL